MRLLLIPALAVLATALHAAPSSIVQVWSGVAAFKDATPENAMAAELRKPGKAGNVSHEAIFLHPQSEGVATLGFRVKLPALAPGERLILSTLLGISDGIKPNGPQNPFDGAGFAIRIGDQQLFHEVVAEVAWLPRAFDLAPWAGQEITLTLATDCGGHGGASYDWAMFGEPQIVLLQGNALDADGAATGSGGAILLEYGNAAPDASLTLAPQPDGPGLRVPLTASGLIYREFGTAELGTADAFRVAAQGATIRDLRVCLHQPHLSIETLGSESALTFAGQPLKVSLRVRNDGKAALLPIHKATVSLTLGGEQPLPRIEPGATTDVTWGLPPQPAGTLALAATARWNAGESTEQTTVAVRAPMPELPQEAPARAEAMRLPDGTYLLQSPRLRLAFLTVNGRPGPIICYARAGGAWVQVAVIPEAAAPVETGKAQPPATLDSATRVGSATLSLTGPGQSVAYTLRNDSPRVEVLSRLKPDQDASITRFAGPRVLVGDGTSGRAKRMALYPGLEYLEGNEESSSTLDAAPPINNRLMPHPLKVTIPLMAVETPDALVALLWDNNQKWDGEHTMPCGAFASPNFVDGQANHLMQVFAPSCPDWVDENALVAAKPYELKAGAALTLRQHLVIDAGAPVLAAIDHWAAEYGGVPEPEQEPRDLDAEIALSRYGFMHTVWDDATNKARHCVGWEPANSPGFANLLLFDARITGNAQARERADLIIRQTADQQGKPGLLSPACCHILNGELPFHAGYLPDVYPDMRRAALGAIGGQRPDGSWRYFPPEGHADLGAPDTPTLGLCARPTWVLMRWARYTGDSRAFEAGLKGLAYMGEHFRVPRGAQGWECPVHEPDILGSAYALAAYLEAFRATGDQKYLDQARYWAKTGLPFLYLWDDPALPGMRYASIPVFGTTFFTHSWLGVPVQWCGLVYAYHLQHLARYDKSFPWDRVAAGITVSGMVQQFGDERPELKGTYPDGWYGHFTQRNAPFINPEDIILNRLVMAGHDTDPDTAIVTVSDERFHITTGARIGSVQSRGGSVRLRLTYFPGESSFGFVANVARPESIILDGKALDAVADLQAATSSAWQYDESQAALFIRIAHGQAPCELTLSGLQRAFPKPPPGRTSWDFTGGPQGWQGEHSCSLVATPDGTLECTVTGADPYFQSGPASIDASKSKRLVVRARMTAGEALGLFWTTEESPGTDELKHVNLSFPCDGQWHEVAFDLATHPEWRGQVTLLRLDPEPATVPAGTLLELDWIRPE